MLTKVQEVYEANWREFSGGGYTRPASRYPYQWYWDSCFQALVWKHLNPERGLIELETLLSASREGFIGHTIFWEKGPGYRYPFYNLKSRDRMTSTIQPPLLAWSYKLLGKDPRKDERIIKHYEWLKSNRVEDGVLWMIQPDESGLDASPKFDELYKGRTCGRPGFMRLVKESRALNFDYQLIKKQGTVYAEVMSNVLYLLSLEALGEKISVDSFLEKFYDENSGAFYDLTPQGPGPKILTSASLTPLMLDLPDEITHTLIERYLLSEEHFWTPCPIPSVSVKEPSYSDRESWPFKRYWRGPSWVNLSWMAWIGLNKYGYFKEANELSLRLARAMRSAGLREYYHPFTGQGMGAADFSWSGLILEMLSPKLSYHLKRVS